MVATGLVMRFLVFCFEEMRNATPRKRRKFVARDSVGSSDGSPTVVSMTALEGWQTGALSLSG